MWEKSDRVRARRIPEQEKRVQQSQRYSQFIAGSDSEMEDAFDGDNSFVDCFSEGKGLIGARIRVWWSDGDGDRWELGKIIGNKTRVSFIVDYDFLKNKNEDTEVIENLLGKRREKWEVVNE